MTNLKEIQDFLKYATEEQRLELIRLCNIENNKTKENLILLKLKNNYQCPYCQSNKVCKNGRTGKAQQFRCNACKKNYSIRTNTIFFHTRKTIELWQEYIEYFSQGLSLRKIVEKMDKKISLPTAFYWRHKILEVMKNFDNHDKLDGIVEADETFFEESQKGNKHIENRKPRKRGYSCYSYTQKKKVCVLTAIDRNKHSFNKPVCYGHIGKEQATILQHRIKENSILITDGEHSYRRLKDVKLKQLKFGKPQIKDNKIIHMNTINSFHSGLKKFMIRFNGVATKYLDNYVNYFREFRDKIDTFNQLLQLQGCYRLVDLRKRRVCFENVEF